MAELCNQLVTQAHAVVDAHRWMRGAHIVFPDLNPAGHPCTRSPAAPVLGPDPLPGPYWTESLLIGPRENAA